MVDWQAAHASAIIIAVIWAIGAFIALSLNVLGHLFTSVQNLYAAVFILSVGIVAILGYAWMWFYD